MFVIINTEGSVEMTNVFLQQFPQAVEAPNDIVFGDKYIDGGWIRCGNRPGPIVFSPADLRERAYEFMVHKEDGTALIEWEEKAISVDQANKTCLAYWIEDNPKADEIKKLIIFARKYIRGIYPDFAPDCEVN